MCTIYDEHRLTDLEDVSPILALIIEPLIQHLHYLYKIVPILTSEAKSIIQWPRQRTGYRSFGPAHSFEYHWVPRDHCLSLL